MIKSNYFTDTEKDKEKVSLEDIIEEEEDKIENNSENKETDEIENIPDKVKPKRQAPKTYNKDNINTVNYSKDIEFLLNFVTELKGRVSNLEMELDKQTNKVNELERTIADKPKEIRNDSKELIDNTEPVTEDGSREETSIKDTQTEEEKIETESKNAETVEKVKQPRTKPSGFNLENYPVVRIEFDNNLKKQRDKLLCKETYPCSVDSVKKAEGIQDTIKQSGILAKNVTLRLFKCSVSPPYKKGAIGIVGSVITGMALGPIGLIGAGATTVLAVRNSKKDESTNVLNFERDLTLVGLNFIDKLNKTRKLNIHLKVYNIKEVIRYIYIFMGDKSWAFHKEELEDMSEFLKYYTACR